MFRLQFIIFATILALSRTELLTARYDSCNLLIDDILYVFGGKADNLTILTTVEILNLTSSTSRTVDYHTPFEYMTCLTLDGKIYVLGTADLTRLYEFDGQAMIYSNINIGNVYSKSNYVRDEYIIMNSPNVVSGGYISKSFGIINVRAGAVAYIDLNCVGSSAIIYNYSIYYAGGLCNNASNFHIYVYNTSSASVISVGDTYPMSRVYIGIYDNRIDVVGNNAFPNGTEISSSTTSERHFRYLNTTDTTTYFQSLPRMDNIDNYRFVSTKYGLMAYNESIFFVANSSVRAFTNVYPIAKSLPVYIDENTYMFIGGLDSSSKASNKVYSYSLSANTFNEVIFSNDAPIIQVPTATISPETVTPEGSLTPNQPNDYTIVIVVVIVVVVAVSVAVAVLTVLLKRRQRKRRIRGDVKFIKELGAGSYGKVYLAKWQGTDVAVKVSSGNSSDFDDETKLMIELPPHPNIVQVLGISKHPSTGESLLVLEYCNGTSLDRLLYDTEENLTQAKQIELAKMICQGMLHLHNNRIVHRDLSSRNVLLHNGVAKISDFGMARTIGSSAQGHTKTNIGPVRWMSPESLRNNSYSYKSDVWSFGIVIYEILARSEPHINIDPIEVGKLIRDQHLRPIPPSGSNKVLIDIMDKCLASNPDDRPSFEQICSMLES